MRLKHMVPAAWIIIGCGWPIAEACADVRQNKAIVVRTVAEFWSRGDLPIADKLYAADFVCHNLVGPDWHGIAGIKDAVRNHRAAFPDWSEHIDDVIGEGDRVVIRLTATGTQRGPFVGIPPTNHVVTVREMSIYRVVGGKIVEQWGMPDIHGMLTQLHSTP